MLKKIAKYVIIFISLILVFNILLFITSLFPSSWIRENVEESAETLTAEGINKVLYSIITMENCTDTFMINMAYSIDNTNPIHSYMSARKNYDKNITETELGDIQGDLITFKEGSEINEKYDPQTELTAFLEGDINVSVTYARYWHGWLVIYRTLLIFFNIVEIRRFQLIIFIILFIWIFKVIKEKIGILETTAFCASLLMVNYFLVSTTLADAPGFVLMMISCIIILKRNTKIKDLNIFFFVIGCIINFIDFLRAPLITWGMPLLLYIAYMQKNDENLECRNYIKIIFKTFIAWIIGYAVTWFAKWLIYDLLYQGNIITMAIKQVYLRSWGMRK